MTPEDHEQDIDHDIKQGIRHSRGRKRTRNLTPYMMILLFSAAMLLGYFGISSVPSISPVIQNVMSLTPGQLGVLMVSFYVGTTIMSFLYTFFLSKQTVKVSMSAGLIIIGGFLVLASFTSQFWLLFLLLSLSGLGYGILAPAVNKGIIAWAPPKLCGTAMSFKQVGVMLGGSIGGGILPSLALKLGVSPALVLVGSVIVVAGILALFFYKEKEIPWEPIHAAGTSGEVLPRREYGFWDVLKNRKIVLVTVIGMILVSAQFSYFMYLSLYLTTDFQYSIVLAGSLLSLASLGGAVGRITWGSVSDFWFGGDRKIVLTIITAVSFLLCLMLAAIPAGIPLFLMAALVFAYGMTVGGWNGVLQVFVIELADARHAGVVSGFNLAFIYIGLAERFFTWLKWTKNLVN